MKQIDRPGFKERSFGISVGPVLMAIAAYLAWRGRTTPASVTGGIGVMLTILGLTAPMLLKWPAAVWWKFALVLGYVNARVILTIAFVIVLTPIGLLWRMINHDPLSRRRKNWPGWSPSPARFKNPDHFNRMY
jgi:hypothetical protein